MIAPAALYAAIDGTWPAAEIRDLGPWTLRHGLGGGKRVSAATARGPVSVSDIAAAEDAMAAMGQRPLVMITDGQEALDQTLEAREYRVVDPVTVYTTPISTLTDVPIPRVTAFAIWKPLAIMDEIWETDGVGPARRAVMARAACPMGILARHQDQPAGVGFVAVHDRIAMVHAVTVLPHQRRRGVAGWIMRQAAFWAQDQGAETMAVLTVKDNGPANALYQRLGFQAVCDYHYRIKPETS